MSPSPPLLRVQHSRCNMEFSQPLTLEPERALKQRGAAVFGKVECWRCELET